MRGFQHFKKKLNKNVTNNYLEKVLRNFWYLYHFSFLYDNFPKNDIHLRLSYLVIRVSYIKICP